MFHVHPNPKEALEICLLRMIAFNPLKQDLTGVTNSSEIEKKNKKIEITPSIQLDKLEAENVKKN